MLRIGLYKHYKGTVYRMLMTALFTESEEEKWFVIYKNEEKDGPNYARPIEMWTEKVKHEGKIVSRFTYIGK
jgi:hypothetical protein